MTLPWSGGGTYRPANQKPSDEPKTPNIPIPAGPNLPDFFTNPLSFFNIPVGSKEWIRANQDVVMPNRQFWRDMYAQSPNLELDEDNAQRRVNEYFTWLTKAPPTYWDNPIHVARWRILDANLPEQTPRPQWIDRSRLASMYDYMASKNEGKDWWEWQPLDPSDPMKALYRGMEPPPFESMPDFEQKAFELFDQRPEQLKATLDKLNMVNSLQQKAETGMEFSQDEIAYMTEFLRTSDPVALEKLKTQSAQPMEETTQGLSQADWDAMTWGERAEYLIFSTPDGRPNLLGQLAQGTVSGLSSAAPIAGVQLLSGNIPGAAATLAGGVVWGTAIPLVLSFLESDLGREFLKATGQTPEGVMEGLYKLNYPALAVETVMAEAGRAVTEQGRSIPPAGTLSMPMSGTTRYDPEQTKQLEAQLAQIAAERQVSVAAGEDQNLRWLARQYANQMYYETVVGAEGRSATIHPVDKPGTVTWSAPEGYQTAQAYVLEMIEDDIYAKLAKGESIGNIEMVYGPMVTEYFGTGSLWSNLIAQSALDPSDMIPQGIKATGARIAQGAVDIAEKTGRPATSWKVLEQAIDEANDFAFSPVLGPVSAITGPIAIARAYSRVANRIPVHEAAQISAFGRWLSGLDVTGLPKGAPARTGIAQVLRPFDYLFGATPEARVYTVVRHASDSSVAWVSEMARNGNTPEQMIESLDQIAKATPDQYGQAAVQAERATVKVMVGGKETEAPIPRMFQSGEAQPALMALKDIIPAARTLLTEFRAAGEQRALLTDAAQKIGITPFELMAGLLDDTKRGGYEANAAAKGVQNATGLRKAAETFFAPKSKKPLLPFGTQDFGAHLCLLVAEGAENWAVQRFGIRPPGLVNRMLNLIKTVQGLLLFDFNPNYLANNTINNYMTMLWDGLISTMSAKTRKQLLDRFGRPSFLRQGYGAGAAGEIFEAGLKGPQGEDIGSIVREARKGSDAVQKADDFASNLRRRIGVTSRASAYMEQAASEMAVSKALFEEFGKRWRPAGAGKGGYRPMPAQLKRELNTIQPGLGDRVEAAPMKALNIQEIDDAIFSKWGERSAKELMSADEYAKLAAFPDLLQQLEAAVRVARSGQDLDRAVDAINTGMLERIRQNLTNEARGMMEQAAARVQVDGAQALLDMIDQLTPRLVDHWVNHQDAAHAAAAEAAANPAQRPLIWARFRRAQNLSWRNFDLVDASSWAGIHQAMGGDPARSAWLRMWEDQHYNREDYFQKVNRNAERMDAGEINWEQYNTSNNENYVRMVAEDDALQVALDRYFEQKFEAQFPGQGASARQWREAIRNTRRQMMMAEIMYRSGKIPQALLDAWGPIDPQMARRIETMNGKKPVHQLEAAQYKVAQQGMAMIRREYLRMLMDSSNGNPPGKRVPPPGRPPAPAQPAAPAKLEILKTNPGDRNAQEHVTNFEGELAQRRAAEPVPGVTGEEALDILATPEPEPAPKLPRLDPLTNLPNEFNLIVKRPVAIFDLPTPDADYMRQIAEALKQGGVEGIHYYNDGRLVMALQPGDSEKIRIVQMRLRDTTLQSGGYYYTGHKFTWGSGKDALDAETAAAHHKVNIPPGEPEPRRSTQPPPAPRPAPAPEPVVEPDGTIKTDGERTYVRINGTDQPATPENIAAAQGMAAGADLVPGGSLEEIQAARAVQRAAQLAADKAEWKRIHATRESFIASLSPDERRAYERGDISTTALAVFEEMPDREHPLVELPEGGYTRLGGHDENAVHKHWYWDWYDRVPKKEQKQLRGVVDEILQAMIDGKEHEMLGRKLNRNGWRMDFGHVLGVVMGRLDEMQGYSDPLTLWREGLRDRAVRKLYDMLEGDDPDANFGALAEALGDEFGEMYDMLDAYQKQRNPVRELTSQEADDLAQVMGDNDLVAVDEQGEMHTNSEVAQEAEAIRRAEHQSPEAIRNRNAIREVMRDYEIYADQRMINIARQYGFAVRDFNDLTPGLAETLLRMRAEGRGLDPQAQAAMDERILAWRAQQIGDAMALPTQAADPALLEEPYAFGRAALERQLRQAMPDKVTETLEIFDRLVRNINPDLKDRVMGWRFGGEYIPRGGIFERGYQPSLLEPGFTDWFQNSQVVDSAGRPLVVYHGTNAEFDAFAKTNDIGFHFGDRRAATKAGRGTGKVKRGETWNVGAYYLSIQNPLEVPDLRDWNLIALVPVLKARNVLPPDFPWQRVLDEASELAYQREGPELRQRFSEGRSKGATQEQWNQTMEEGGRIFNEARREVIVNYIKKAGYDGLVYMNAYEGGRSYVALDANQIKSIRNVGTYNPDDPRFLYEAEATTTPILERAVELFGITDNPGKAGLILPDGRWLNLHRDEGGGDFITHGDVAYELYGLPYDKRYGYQHWLSRMLEETGMVRVDFTAGIVQAHTPLTRRQISSIADGMVGIRNRPGPFGPDTRPLKTVYVSSPRGDFEFNFDPDTIKDDLRQALAEVGLREQAQDGTIIRGMTTFTRDLQGMVNIFHSGTVGTVLEEAIHSLTPHLSDADADMIASEYARLHKTEVPRKTWNREFIETEEPGRYIPTTEHIPVYEWLAKAFKRYMMEGEAPSASLTTVFAKIKSWLFGVYKTLTGGANDVPISPEIRNMFDRWLADEPTPPRDAVPPDPFGPRRPAQMDMFSGGEDLPLMTGTAMRARPDQGVAPVNPPQAEALIDRAQYLRQIGEANGLFENTRSPIFYSQLMQTIEQKMPNRATVEQIRGILKGTVKESELNWTGFNDWLDMQDGPVTKQEAISYLQEHQIVYQEIVRGAPAPAHKAVWARVNDAWMKLSHFTNMLAHERFPDEAPPGVSWNDWTPEQKEASRRRGEVREPLYLSLPQQKRLTTAPEIIASFGEEVAQRWMALRQAYVEARELANSIRVSGKTRWEKYTVPGGVNHREFLMLAPRTKTKRVTGTPEQVKARVMKKVDLDDVALAMFGTRYTVMSGIGKGEVEATAKNLAGLQDVERYQSAHWKYKDVAMHIRTTDRKAPDGSRMLAIEEFQTDWGTSLREAGGILTPQEVMDLIEQAEFLRNELDNAFEQFPELQKAIETEEAVREWLRTKYPVDDPRGEYTEEGELRGAEQWSEEDRYQLLRASDEVGYQYEALRNRQVALQRAAGWRGGVPDFPYSKNYTELAMKRAIRFAVDNGYQSVGWFGGETHADRWGSEAFAWGEPEEVWGVKIWRLKATRQLAGHVEGIADIGVEMDRRGMGKSFNRQIKSRMEVREAVERIVNTSEWNPLIAYNYIEKITDRIWTRMQEGPGALLPRQEGLMGYYNNEMVNVTRKLIKKWGGEVKEAAPSIGYWQAIGTTGKPYGLTSHYKTKKTAADWAKTLFQLMSDREKFVYGKFVRVEPAPGPKMYVFEITPQMREAVTGGLPLFEADPFLRLSGRDAPTALPSYMGNKNTMLEGGNYDQIVPAAIVNRVDRVVDAFGGSGLLGSTFRKVTRKPGALNEFDPEVAGFHRTVQSNPEGVITSLNRIRDEIAGLVQRYPGGGLEASQAVRDYWQALYPRLQNGSAEDQAALVVVRNSALTPLGGEGQNIITGEDAKLGSYVWKFKTVTFDNLAKRLRTYSSSIQGVEITQLDAREVVRAATERDLVVLDPPYVMRGIADERVSVYPVGQELSTVEGAVKFIDDVMADATRRGVPIIYTNNPHPSIQMALDRAGFDYRIVEVQSASGTRDELVAWNTAVRPSRLAGRGEGARPAVGAAGTGGAVDLPDRTQPGQLPARPAGAGRLAEGELSTPAVNAPLGTADSLLPAPTSRGVLEGYSREIEPILSSMKQRYREQPKVANTVVDLRRTLPPETMQRVRGWAAGVYTDMSDAKALATGVAKTRRDQALLDYNARTGMDNLLQVVFPYHFWYTRSMLNWAKRAIARPTLVNNWLRWHRIAGGNEEREGMPTRLNGKIGIPLPFLPDWMGDAIYIDPYRQVFPFEQMLSPFEQYFEGRNMVEKKAISYLEDWADDESISRDQANQAMSVKSGPLWERALAQAEYDTQADQGGNPSAPWGPGASRNLVDLAFGAMSPSLPISLLYNAATGRPMNPLPITRFIQNATQLVGLGGPRGFQITRDRFDDYREDRMLANMAGTGEITGATFTTRQSKPS